MSTWLGLWSLRVKQPELSKQVLPQPRQSEAPVTSINQLPPEIQAALIALCDPCAFADSNAPWNGTDAIIDGSLPSRRITSVMRVGEEWRIKYERGGFAGRNYTVVFGDRPPFKIVAGSSCVPFVQQACDW